MGTETAAKFVKFSLFVYQGLTRSQIRTCRFIPTCSGYAVQAVEKYGLVQGSLKTLLRLASCHPFTKRPIYDPA